MRPQLLLLFCFIITGCNSKFAELGRLTPIHFFNFQFGLSSEPVPGSYAEEEVCVEMAQDSEGNIYCAGHTKGDFAETNLSSDADVLLIKMGPKGELIWATQLGQNTRVPAGGPSNNANSDSCLSIAVDQLNNVYCAGKTDGFLGGNKVGQSDAFVLKLNSAGELQWVKQFGTVQEDFADQLVILPGGDIVVAGNTESELVPGEGSSNFFDVFVARLSPDGTILWTKQLGQSTLVSLGRPAASGSDTEFTTSLVVDNASNIYLAGITSGNLAETNAGAGGNDLFLWRLDSAGNSIGLKQFGAISAPFATANDKNFELAIDDKNNLYWGGSTAGSYADAHAGARDVYIFKTDQSGNFIWKTQFGLSQTVPNGNNVAEDVCLSIALNKFSLYCVGTTEGSFAEPHAGGAGKDTFILELDPANGRFKDAVQFGAQTNFPGGNNTGDDIAMDITVDSRDRIHLAGYTTGNFGSENAAVVPGTESDIFVIRLDDNHRPNYIDRK